MTPYYADDLVTLYHADCRDLLDQLSFDAVVTDPPYGVDAQHRVRGGAAIGPVEWDDSVYPHDVVNGLADRGPTIAFGSASTLKRELDAFTTVPRVGVWAPSFRTGMAAKDGLAWRWHPVYLFGIVNGGPTIHDVWTTPTEGDHAWWTHPASKPVNLLRSIVGTTSGVVLDPYVGSGTTLVAAMSMGRRSIGIEISERYCEIAATRLAQRTFAFPIDGDQLPLMAAAE